MTTRRTKDQVDADRERIVDYLHANGGFVRSPEWARPVDVAALETAGRISRYIRTEYDSQTGYAANLFGGAGAMRRRRLYLRDPAKA